ncbi:MAG TPA: hypothetical protein VGQ36_04820 [Thermoanaerobaculia bacterium]|jgi:hypothetical protein|nr:hypothetical protein [Thermoanaerobaculia bacterium]
MRLRLLLSFSLVLLVLLVSVDRAQDLAPVTSPPISISPVVPDDVPGGAAQADLRTGARFAWQQFIALNWPASEEGRDTPDVQRKFGEVGKRTHMVWETFRSKVEIYPGNGDADHGPHGSNKGAPSYGYDDDPRYIYENGEVKACSDAEASTTAWVNLDEISQVGFDFMYAGAATPGPHTEIDANSRLIRFTAKANRKHYEYIVGNKYWYVTKKPEPPSPAQVAQANFVAAVYANQFPPADPYVRFPNGSMEVKAAFRRLTSKEALSGRFYMTTVRYYAKNAAGHPCYNEEEWGLLGLHIIQKTPTAPSFTWATFEQADNLLTADGHFVENANGAVLRKTQSETTPALRYQDGLYRDEVAPIVTAQGPYCSDPGARLFYRDVAVDPNTGANYKNTPHGFVCVNRRAHAIPDAVIAVNREAHQAIERYEIANGVRKSPWHHYKLVNVQTYPFDKSSIAAPNSARGAATYYTANIVVETDYTLQHNSGGPATRTGGAPSDMAVNYLGRAGQPPPELTYKNTYVLNQNGTLRARYNMGGCTGCHGLAQIIAGCDYSYLLVGSSVKEPETPDTKIGVLANRYHGRLAE